MLDVFLAGLVDQNCVVCEYNVVIYRECLHYFPVILLHIYNFEDFKSRTGLSCSTMVYSLAPHFAYFCDYSLPLGVLDMFAEEVSEQT